MVASEEEDSSTLGGWNKGNGGVSSEALVGGALLSNEKPWKNPLNCIK